MRRATLSRPPVFALAEHAPGRLTLRADTGAVAHVFVLEDDIVRLTLLPDGRFRSGPSWAIAPGAEDVPEPGRDRMSVEGFACPDFDLGESDGTLTVNTARLRLSVRFDGFHCLWEQRVGADWAPMAEDRPTQAYNFGWWDKCVHHYLVRRPGERWFGLGEKSGMMDRAGRRLRLRNLDAMGYDAERSDPLYKHIPYVLTADATGACHGALYDNTSDMVFDFGQELDNYHGPYRSVGAAHGDLDLWMIAGPNPLDVTRRLTWLTGRPALMPRWSLGYSGSTMSYTDAPDAQAQMARFIDRLEEHDIGCTSFHLSSGYTSIGATRHVFHWNRDKFPDPRGFVQSYRDAGVRLVANVKPVLLHDHPCYAEASAKHLFVFDADGTPAEVQFWGAIGAALDFTNPETSAWWRGRMTEALLSAGIAATWNDNNECEVWDAAACVAGFGESRPIAEVRPLQSMLMMRASRLAQLAHAPETRPYVVTRSGMTGMQRYAQTWSGDNSTSWKSLKYNVRMGLGLALSGVSNAGHDVGGFAGSRPDPELFLRWLQAGILMPRFSIHSWNDDGTVNEPWMYPEILPAVRRLMALRQTLVPFFDDLAWRYHRDFEPMIRPLWLDHPDDPRAWHDGEEHLLGRDVLAAPVVERDVDHCNVYLPGSDDWFDVWSGECFAGRRTVTVPALLDGPPPLFVRAGSGILVDLAQPGFRPARCQPGLWLFPPSGEGRFAWNGQEPHEEAIEGNEPAGSWHVEGVAVSGRLRLDVQRAGSAANLFICLPTSEHRVAEVTGAGSLFDTATSQQ